MCFSETPPQAPARPVTIRSVWSHNVDAEFAVIRLLIDHFPNISMDTEFPGVVFTSDSAASRRRNSAEHYRFLKANVDRLKLLQIGLTLSNDAGELPDLCGDGGGHIWEINFRDFDAASDPHAPSSIELLREHGMDFDRNRSSGVDSVRFAELMISSGLVCNDSVSWITFHSAYDFGYLVKVLTQRVLPSELAEFLELVRLFFGSRVFDVKHVMRFSQSLHGGLDRVCQSLNVGRVAGKSHQAGSDSLLTWHAFEKIRELYVSRVGGVEQYAGVLYGLEIA